MRTVVEPCGDERQRIGGDLVIGFHGSRGGSCRAQAFLSEAIA